MQRKQRIGLGIVGTCLVASALGFSLGSARASGEDAIRTLGFEATADWTVAGGTVATSEDRTQASLSLAVVANGYTTLTSRLLGPLGNVAETVTLDLKIPANQVNPDWFGDAQLFVSIPSLNVYDAYVGQRSLSGLAPSSYAELAFSLSPTLRDQLSQTVYDIQFKIVLNVPSGNTEPYLLDNLQVSSTIPGRSTISSADIPRILAFESSLDWSGTGIVFSSATRSEGNTALGMVATGYNVVTSVPMTSVAPVASEVKLDVFVPELQPNPGWYGAVALYVSVPSKGIYNQHLGEVQLTGKPTGEFSTVSFPVTPSLQATLNAGGYSDLRFSIAFNVPQGAGTYYVDRMQVGEVTAPPPPVTAQVRDDYVGRTASGVFLVEIDEHSAAPPVLDALIKIKEEDEGCVPSTAVSCRYLVNLIRFVFGPFTLDRTYSHATVTLETPFRMTIGGAHGLVGFVPSNALFGGKIEDGSLLLWFTSSSMTLSILPTVDLITIAGQLQGSADGHTFSLAGFSMSDIPLVNKRPMADAGPPKVAIPSSGCQAFALMDGSGTMDPSGDLELVKWYYKGSLYGRGVTPNIEFRRSGTYELELVATDSFFSESRAKTTVSVSLPPDCGSIGL